MKQLGKFLITEILDERRCRVYRGYLEDRKTAAIIKVFGNDRPSQEEINAFRHEYEQTQKIDFFKDYWIEATNLEGSPALIMKDTGGQSLEKILATRSLSLTEFLKVSIATVSSLVRLHARQIIHRAVQPSHIIVYDKFNQATLISYSVSDHPYFPTPTMFQDQVNAAYDAPERWEEGDAVFDTRSDLYSLGIVFYEMLFQKLPFSEGTPLEKRYSHYTQWPEGLQEGVPPFPKTILAIIRKLLFKDRNARYQTADALKMDLEICYDSWHATQVIPDLNLAQADRLGAFEGMTKLYDRETEMAQIMEAYQQTTPGASTILLIRGESGIGKTFLIQEMATRIKKESDGWVLHGGFQANQQMFSYSAWIEIIRSLFTIILSTRDDEIQLWKKHLLQSVGDGIVLLLKIIPEAKFLFSDNDKPLVRPTESSELFSRVLQETLKAASQRTPSLTLVLEDIQWADEASLGFLNELFSLPALQGIFLLLTSRELVTSKKDRWAQLIRLKKNPSVNWQEIILEPLGRSAITKVLTELTLQAENNIQDLVKIVQRFTKGNPFFLNELLMAACHHRVFFLENHQWHWKLDALEKNIPSQIAELLLQNIQKLSPKTLQLLKLSSCFNKQIDPSFFAKLDGVDFSSPIRFLLKEAHEWGLVTSTTPYRFLHDKIVEALQSLISHDEERQIYFQLGKHLENEKRLYRRELLHVTKRLDSYQAFFLSDSEQWLLAELNYRAGHLSKESADYQEALFFYCQCLNCLPPDVWERSYTFCLALHVDLVEVYYLTSDYQKMEEFAKIVRNRAKAPHDLVKIIEVQISYHTNQSQFREAVTLGMGFLEMSGIHLPRSPSKWYLATKILPLLALKWRSQSVFLTLPQATNLKMIMAERILFQMATPAYSTNPNLFLGIVLKGIHLVQTYGVTSRSPSVFAIFGAIIGNLLADYQFSRKLGNIGLELVANGASDEAALNVNFVFGLLIHCWSAPLEESAAYFRKTFESAPKVGDFQTTGLAIGHYCNLFFFLGENLEKVIQRFQKYQTELLKYKHRSDLDMHYLGLYWAYSCRGDNALFDEAIYVKRWQHTGAIVMLTYYYLVKAHLAYYHEDFAEAYDYCVKAKPTLDSLQGQYLIVVFNWVYSLTLCEAFESASLLQKKNIRSQIRAYQKQMKKWSHSCPHNFLHLYQLIEARRLESIEWNVLEAETVYLEVLKVAKERPFVQHEALINELAASFFVKQNKTGLAQECLERALYCYQRWGASPKIERIKIRMQQISYLKFPEIHSLPNESPETVFSKSELMLDSLLEASREVSEQVELPTLLETLFTILLKNTGASKGAFFLSDNDTLRLKALAKTLNEIQIFSEPETTGLGSQSFPKTLLDYVFRTHQAMWLDITTRGMFANDSYFFNNPLKSIVCLPVKHQSRLIGILYLEYFVSTDILNKRHKRLITVLVAQAAISIENAHSFEALQKYQLTLSRSMERLASLKQLSNNIVNIKNANRVIEILLEEFHALNLGSEIFYLPKEKTLESLVSQQEIKQLLEQVSSWEDIQFVSNPKTVHASNLQGRGHIAVLPLPYYDGHMVLYRKSTLSGFDALDKKYLENVGLQIEANWKNMSKILEQTRSDFRKFSKSIETHTQTTVAKTIQQVKHHLFRGRSILERSEVEQQLKALDFQTEPQTILLVKYQKPYSVIEMVSGHEVWVEVSLLFLEWLYPDYLVRASKSVLINHQQIIQLKPDYEKKNRHLIYLKKQRETVMLPVGRGYVQTIRKLLKEQE